MEKLGQILTTVVKKKKGDNTKSRIQAGDIASPENKEKIEEIRRLYMTAYGFEYLSDDKLKALIGSEVVRGDNPETLQVVPPALIEEIMSPLKEEQAREAEKRAKEEEESRKKAEEFKALQETFVAKYGSAFESLTEKQMCEIQRAENEITLCNGCHGLPCQKSINQHRIPRIERGEGQIVVFVQKCEPYLKHLKQCALSAKLESSKIPARYVGKLFADYKVDSLNEIAVLYAKSALLTGKGAFLYGERGTGKTFLAAIIAQEFLRAGKTVIFVKVPRLMEDLYSAIRNKGANEGDILKELYTVDLLVLDDMGMEKSTLYTGATLCKIIDTRYDRELTTIITSNNSLEQIRYDLDNATDGKSYNGSRIEDRCREFCKPILLKGTSRRR